MSNEINCEDAQTAKSAVSYGCIFCRTGNEKILTQKIEAENPQIVVLMAEKLRRRRMAQRYIEERVPLFPGYLFFCAQNSDEVLPLMRSADIYRVLRNSDGTWQLQGEDKTFARRLFAQNGVIGLSKAYFEGEKIRIIEGVLKEYEGRILRVNKRAQTVQISMDLCGQEVTTWLGFERVDCP